jgi:hypothetical protein
MVDRQVHRRQDFSETYEPCRKEFNCPCGVSQLQCYFTKGHPGSCGWIESLSSGEYLVIHEAAGGEK